MNTCQIAALICVMALSSAVSARAQMSPSMTPDPAAGTPTDSMAGMDMMDDAIIAHALIEQLEDRFDGSSHGFRYDAQAWAGTDYDKLWVKSEGRVLGNGRFTDGQHEILYDRATSTFLDLQAGVRFDADKGKPRTWGAFGIQGLSLYFVDIEATAYVNGEGNFAARTKASFDLLLTQRLILQPEIELNFYSKTDPGRGTGSGLSDIDTGLRLRYEITRKLAPYVGVAYEGFYGQSAGFARKDGESTSDVRFVLGVRTLF
jgi:copper resistance protein B